MNKISVYLVVPAFLGLAFFVVATMQRDGPAPRPIIIETSAPSTPDAGAGVQERPLQSGARDPAENTIVARISALKVGSDEGYIRAVVAELASCPDRQWVTHIIGGISDQVFAGYLLNRLALEWASQNPSETVVWLRGLPTGMERTEAMISAHRVWAETDPRRAVTSALELPASPLRQTALSAVLSAWIRQDLPAASAWVDQFGADAALDSAIAEIARTPALIETHADVALTWAESITNKGLRQQSLAMILSGWSERDRSAAIRYINNSLVLDATEKSDLRELLNLTD